MCCDKLSHREERIDFKQINCVTCCEGFDKQFNWGRKYSNIPRPFHLPFITSPSCFSTAWPMETIIVHRIGAASTEEVWCGMHTLIGESNQWWNLSTPDASVETGIIEAFQQPPTPPLLVSEGGKDGSAWLNGPTCYGWGRDNLLFLYKPPLS